MTESNEWTDWIPEIERIKRMQADIDALKCEREQILEILNETHYQGPNNASYNVLVKYGYI